MLFQRKYALILITLFAAAFIFTAGCIQEADPVYPEITPDMEKLLDDYISVQKNLQTETEAVLEKYSKELGKVPYGSDGERAVLREIYAAIPGSLAVTYYNAKTDELIFVPWTTNYYSANDIKVTDEEKDSILLHGPFDSDTYSQVVAVSYPVYAEDGIYLGRIALYYAASELVNAPIKQLEGAGKYTIAALKEDGTFIYASHNAVIGTNINDRDGEIVRDTDKSGKYYTKTYNTMNPRKVSYSGIWKTEKICGRNITYLIGTTDSGETDYTKFTADPLGSENAVTTEMLAKYVQSMYFYADRHTLEETVDYVKTLEPLTAKSSYTAFVGTFDGEILAVAQRPSYTGIKMSQITDSYSKSVFGEMELRALQGGGYVYFYSDDKLAAVPEEAVFNIAYVIPVGREYYVGASIPAKTTVSKVDTNAVDDVRGEMSQVLAYFYKNGKEKTIEAINADAITPGTELKIRAVSNDGTCLANNKNHENAGKFVLGETDELGNSPGREAVILANKGSGFMYRSDEDENGDSKISLCFIEPMEGGWLVSVSKVIETIKAEEKVFEGGVKNAA